MNNIVRFGTARRNANKRRHRFGMVPFLALLLVAFATSFIVLDSLDLFGARPQSQSATQVPFRAFNKCGSGSRINCVVDGDTLYLDGTKIRVADIDTPETYGSRCAYEADLGARATRRFTQLLNAGPFAIESIAGRDEDRYGRKLRILRRAGISLGAILVSEGLARNWDGRRHPWCS